MRFWNMEKTEIKSANLITRPPVVVVLGHIDHGKTTLLDTIRKTEVAAKESGGITQHIGAYEIAHSGKKITFIDTPGHAAFSEMRSRGAKVADIALLVVAADDGIKPQTEESLQEIKKSQIPYIVVVTKIDKPGADVNKVKSQLAEHEVYVEGWGGKVPIQEVNAKSGEHVSELIDLILLVAELENFQADPDASAEGVIIESHSEPGRGAVATFLIKNGTLHIGNFVLIENQVAKIKSIQNFLTERVNELSFSSPAQVTGFEKLPPLGSKFKAGDKKLLEKEAKQVVSETKIKTEIAGKKIAKFIVKADRQGSLEALEKIFNSLNFKEISAQVVKAETGNISESDIKLAENTAATIIAFRVKFLPQIEQLSQNLNVKVILADVIYELEDKAKEILLALLEPEIIRTKIGSLKILATFKMSAAKMIVGGKVISGKIVKGASIDVIREGKFVGNGKIASLQSNKVDQDEVSEGKEAGIMFVPKLPGQFEIKIGDILEAYEEKIVPRKLE